jgi:type VII secretion integral membrane protein EccD
VATDRTAGGAPALRILPGICCVLLGGFGAVALAWPTARVATAGLIVTGTCLAVAATVAAAVVRRLRGEPMICVPLSLIAVLYAGAVGFLTVPPGQPASGLLLASAVTFSAAILLLRITGLGRTCLTSIATLGALIAAVAAAGATWGLQLNAVGAALVTLSLATLGLAPRLSMVISRTDADAVAPSAGLCHRILTGLVMGSSIAAALGAASVAIGETRGAGSALRDTTFTAVVALVLLLRMRTHVDPTRRAGLAVAAMLAAAGGFVAAAVTAPVHIHVISALAAIAGAAALSCLLSPTVSPIALRIVEVLEYVALAAVVPMACWVGGIYTLARGMNLI